MSSQEEFRLRARARRAASPWNVSRRKIALSSLKSPSRDRDRGRKPETDGPAAALANDAVALRRHKNVLLVPSQGTAADLTFACVQSCQSRARAASRKARWIDCKVRAACIGAARAVVRVRRPASLRSATVGSVFTPCRGYDLGLSSSMPGAVKTSCCDVPEASAAILKSSAAPLPPPKLAIACTSWAA
jgi:hypothetical protein